jgi:hypothetical protein
MIADNNWFARVVVGAAIIHTWDSLHLKCPEVGPDRLKELAAATIASAIRIGAPPITIGLLQLRVRRSAELRVSILLRSPVRMSL